MWRTLPCIVLVSVLGSADGQDRPHTLPAADVLKGAIDRATVATIEVGTKPLKSRIDKNDPKGTWTVDGDTFPSNYEAFRFQAEAGKTVDFEVSVYTTALMPKKTMVPLGFVLAPDNTVVPFAAESLRLAKVFGKSSHELRASWQLVPPSTGTYYLIVAADSRLVGKDVASVRFNGSAQTVSGRSDAFEVGITGAAGESYSIKATIKKR